MPAYLVVFQLRSEHRQAAFRRTLLDYGGVGLCEAALVVEFERLNAEQVYDSLGHIVGPFEQDERVVVAPIYGRIHAWPGDDEALSHWLETFDPSH